MCKVSVLKNINNSEQDAQRLATFIRFFLTSVTLLQFLEQTLHILTIFDEFIVFFSQKHKFSKRKRFKEVLLFYLHSTENLPSFPFLKKKDRFFFRKKHCSVSRKDTISVPFYNSFVSLHITLNIEVLKLIKIDSPFWKDKWVESSNNLGSAHFKVLKIQYHVW